MIDFESYHQQRSLRSLGVPRDNPVYRLRDKNMGDVTKPESDQYLVGQLDHGGGRSGRRPYFVAFFAFAHLAFCAAAILARASGERWRFLGVREAATRLAALFAEPLSIILAC